mmetsp:Transcript_26561/g.58432  ORF Transcript_26561/g.58432 Transcript_26561/m.58432 type:complete len:124 (+) Transcript_26561:582-953(+)
MDLTELTEPSVGDRLLTLLTTRPLILRGWLRSTSAAGLSDAASDSSDMARARDRGAGLKSSLEAPSADEPARGRPPKKVSKVWASSLAPLPLLRNRPLVPASRVGPAISPRPWRGRGAPVLGP